MEQPLRRESRTSVRSDKPVSGGDSTVSFFRLAFHKLNESKEDEKQYTELSATDFERVTDSLDNPGALRPEMTQLLRDYVCPLEKN